MLVVFTANAQLFDYRSIFSKPYKDRTVETGLIRVRLASTANRDSVDREINFIKEGASHLSNKRDVLKEATLIQMFCYNNNNWESPGKRIETIEETISNIKPTNKNSYLKVYGLMLIAEVYWDKLKDYESFFETYNSLIEFVKPITQKQYPELVEIYRRLGNGYYYFGDYDNAIQYLKIAINHPQTSKNFYYLLHCYNGLGLCYQKQNELDSADYYFNKMLSFRDYEQKDRFDGIANGNLGYSEFLRKNYAKAIPLCNKDVEVAKKYHDFGLAGNSLVLLADMYIADNRMKEAKEMLDSAFRYFHVSLKKDRLRLYYPVLARWYIKTGNQAQALVYIDSAKIAKENYDKDFNSLKLIQVQQKIARQQLQITEANLKSEQYRNNMYLALIVGLVSIFSISVLASRRREQLRNIRKEMELKDTANRLLTAQI